MLLGSESTEAQTHSANALWNLAAIGTNKQVIADAGAITPLVRLLGESSTPEAQKFACGALWHLAAVGNNKQAMVAAGAITPLVAALGAEMADAREYAAAVISALSRTQGGNKRAIAKAGGIAPLISLLSDGSIMTQRHAACALWGLAEGREGTFDKQMVEQGAVAPLIAMLMMNHEETRGFAAACLSAVCADPNAHAAIIAAGGKEPLLALAQSPTAWLRSQATQMLQLLGIPFEQAEDPPPAYINSPRYSPRGYAVGAVGETSARSNGPPSNGLPSPHQLPSPGRYRSPRSTARRGSEFGGGGAGSPWVPPSTVQRALPIREESSIDPTIENKVVGELKKGDTVYVLHRDEVAPGVTRAHIATAPGAPPKGWVTLRKEGVDFVTAMGAVVAGKDAPYHVKKRFHFFSFQIDGGRLADR